MSSAEDVVFGPELIVDDDISPKDAEREAEEAKEYGNQLYAAKNFKEALAQYSTAISLCPSKAAFYGNRSACYLTLAQYREALSDAKKAVSLDANFIKGYVRIAKCCLAMGDLVGLEQTIARLQEQGAIENVALEIAALQEVRSLEASAEQHKDDFRRVVYLMDKCLTYCLASYRHKLVKAECLALLGRCQEAQEIANDIFRMDNSNADALYIRGMCLYYQDNVDQALKHFQHVLKLAPDHQKSIELYKKAKLLRQKKEEGNNAFKNERWQEAYDLYTIALLIDPFNKVVNAKLFFNKATVCSKLNRIREAIENCTGALNLDETYLKALLRRAKCYQELDEHDEAVRDYEKAYKMDKSVSNKMLLQNAKIALKKAKRKDYYKILGVDKNASEDDIKKAYRKKALLLHPDRHVGASESERKEQEKQFKDLGEAYGILSDPKKKSRYDCGQDIDYEEYDPNMMFQNFFGGGGPMFTFPGGASFQFG